MILAVDIKATSSVERDGITYFVQLGKIKGANEFHLYIDNNRINITENNYDECIYNETNLKELALKLIEKGKF